MRRLLLTLILLLLAAPVWAQNTSTTQMALARSDTFTARLQYLGWQIAAEVLVEPASAAASGVIPAYSTGCHTLRVAFAQKFVKETAQGALITVVGIAGTNVSGAVLVGTVTGSGSTADSTVADSVLLQAYRVQYNTFAGCFTNLGT